MLGGLSQCAACLHGPCGLAALTLVAALCLWAARRVGPFRPIVLEPGGDLSERLAAVVGQSSVTPSELEDFRRFGVLVVRGVLPDRALLKEVHPALERHQNFHAAEYTYPLHYNGVAREVLRHGFVTAPAVKLFGVEEATMGETPIWGFSDDGLGSGRHHDQAWHIDQPLAAVDNELRLLTGWLAVTDAPHGIEFLRGTWQSSLRAELYMGCNRSRLLGERGERLLDPACVQSFASRVLDKKLGYKSHVWLDLKAGDLAVFDGRLVHRGMEWPRSRLALSFRMRKEDKESCRCNGYCSVFSSNRTARGVDPLECMKWTSVAQPLDPAKWDAWVRLAPAKDMGAGLLLLRRLAGMIPPLPRATWGLSLIPRAGS